MRCSSITNDNKPQKFVFVIIIKRLNQRSVLLFIKIDRLLLFIWCIYTKKKRIRESALYSICQ
jgi:hypothetical protein